MSTITPYSGATWQRGYGVGSIFRGLFKMAMPLARNAGKSLLKAGVKGGVGLAQDALRGRNVKQAAKRRFAGAMGDVLKGMTGQPRRKRQKRASIKRVTRRWVVSRKRSPGTLTAGRRDVFGTYR